MTIPTAIDTLIELATSATDEAAQKLGRAIRAADDTEKKLALLLQYRDEYAARFQANMVAGLTPISYRNYQCFLDKLDQAISGQQQVVREAHRQVATDRTAWQASERKRMSYDTLANRALQAAQRKESKRDQKQSDEHAARQLLYKR
jgi:flagellar FliJ protein